jgi:hypothetical protein
MDQLAQDLIDQQMTQQTDLLKQQLVNQGNLAGRQATAAATEYAANQATLRGLIEQALRGKSGLDVQQARNLGNQIVQGMRGTSATNVANIAAGSRETVAQINADAKRQAAAAAPKGTIGPFAKKPTGVPGVRWIHNADGTWSGIKLSGTAAPKLASPSQRTSLQKTFSSLWEGTKSSFGLTTKPGIAPPPLPANPSAQDIAAHHQAESQASAAIINWMTALHDNFPGASGLKQVMAMIKAADPSGEAYKLAQRWLAGQGANIKSIWP